MNKKALVSITFFCLTSFVIAQIPTEGLVAYWSFTGNANDESGNAHHGTVYGASLTEDRFGNPDAAYQFDGVNDYIGIAPSSLVDNETTVTLSFWLKRDDADDYGLPIHCGNQGRYGVHISKDSVRVNVTTNSNFDGSAPSEFATSKVYFDQEQWSHIVFKYNGANLKLYVNSKLEDEVFAEGNIWTAQSSYLAFGVYMLFNNPSHGYYKGKLDDVRLYNKVLSDDEIASIYQYNRCSDTIINDTITYLVSSENFNDISPLIYHDSTLNLTQVNGGCDSTINYYTQFLFDPTYYTDTTFVTITDTLTIYDSISVTDTLIIDAVLTGIDAPGNMNTLKVYPNPARDYVFINTGDFTKMDGYQLKIYNQLGTTVFETQVEEALYELNLSSWTGTGLYILQLIDSGGNAIEIRKIILQ